MNRRHWLEVSLALASSLAIKHAPARAEDAYRSPYRLRFRHEREALAAGFEQAPWNTPRDEGSVPHADWYDARTHKRWGAWGPPARQYPAPRHVFGKDATFLQDRVILTASRWIGHSYQHHHIPDWNPPAHWPWIKVGLGHNAPGIDCSNFSSFYYNYALGIKLDTGIAEQGERLRVRGPGGMGAIELERLAPRGYEAVLATLQPADLLYIRNNAGKIAHVIMWLGVVGESPDSVPLVLDSTGSGHRDSSGANIPNGVHIRPFGPKSWYFNDFAHAHRIIPSVSRVSQVEAAEASEGGAEFPPR